ncbi:phage terminase large subunit family protein [Aggregatilinea sp.]|uniref:phage terminase large subunit family protein n=1 Tax=Aggregatilinea sp. TaxID=2806333 RepID=UPI002D1FA2C0|nr:terminase family protein [Aggregatilinea sp.]
MVACGRRFGKTETGKILAIERALGGRVVWWISPTYRMAQDVWRSLRATLAGAWTEKNESMREITLPGGGLIRVRSGHDPDALRGSGLDLAVLDEAAYLHPDVWAAAIRPALADRRGEALFLSSPNGRNWFWSLYMRGQNAAQAEWKSWRFPTAANPLIAASEVEAAREHVPERTFRQEYLAEFLDDAAGVFRRVESTATGAPEDGPQPGERIIFGVDWGRDGDFTAIAVIAADRRRLVALERFNEIGWALQRGRLAALAARWGPEAIWAEANSIGGPNIEALQAEGLPVVAFTTTASSKGPLIDGLALALERGDLTLLADPVLIAELQAYALDRLPSGRFRYGAPPGMHDDTVIALALAWHGVQAGSAGISFV